MVNIVIKMDANKALQDLDDFANRILPEAIQAGLDAIAGDVIIGAKNIVPVQTGNLRDSIRILERSPTHIKVGTTVDYAAAVEFGSGGRPAKPYLGPQSDIMQSEGPKIIQDEISRRIKK